MRYLHCTPSISSLPTQLALTEAETKENNFFQSAIMHENIFLQTVQKTFITHACVSVNANKLKILHKNLITKKAMGQ